MWESEATRRSKDEATGDARDSIGDLCGRPSLETPKHASGFFMLSARYFEHGYSVGALLARTRDQTKQGRPYRFIVFTLTDGYSWKLLFKKLAAL
jgi:hypothetical protein